VRIPIRAPAGGSTTAIANGKRAVTRSSIGAA
jgi:hypothetical protein